MAVAIVDSGIVDSAGTYTAGAGSNRLFVWAFGDTRGGAGAPSVTGVLMGTTAMTAALTPVVNSAQRYMLSAIYYLLEADIPSGVQTLAATFAVGEPVDTPTQGYVWTLSGVDQTTPIVATDSATGNTVTSLTGAGVSALTDGIVIANIGKSNDNDTLFNTPSGYTKNGLGNYGFSGSQAVYHKLITSGGTETPAFTFDSSNGSLIIASIRAVASAGNVNLLSGKFGGKFVGKL